MGTGFGKILRQAKMMKDNIARIEEELKDKVFEGSAGGGAVKAVVSGAGKLLSITIDPEVVKSGDVEMLQDLVLTAVNQAEDKAAELHSTELAKLAKGFGIPGMPGSGA